MNRRLDAWASAFEGSLGSASGFTGPLGGRFGHLVGLAFDFFGVITALAKVLRFDIADVQEAVSSDAEIDEGGLDAGFQVDDFASINVAGESFNALSFDIQFFEFSVVQDGDTALFGLEHVHQHFAFHLGHLSGGWAVVRPLVCDC